MAIKYALKELGIPFHSVSREKGKGDLLYEEVNEHVINACKLIINASPLGMYPLLESYPDIPYDHLTEDHLMYDLVYNPEKSKFLKFSESKGAMIMNGMDMLKLQAEESWRIWNLTE